MIFTTKAEYGVRLLVELGRVHGTGEEQAPVSLKAIADTERLPLAYLERIVARLKKAGIVESTRGAHGGYRLARDPSEITMDEVIVALEGAVRPMTCFSAGDEDRSVPSDHRVLCNHTDGAHTCATRLLWTRVQGGIHETLARTTLAELVAFAQRNAPVPAAEPQVRAAV